MNYQSSNFGGEGCWNEKIWKGIEVGISHKIYTIFLPFVKLYIVQKSKEVKLYFYKLSSDDNILSWLI